MITQSHSRSGVASLLRLEEPVAPVVDWADSSTAGMSAERMAGTTATLAGLAKQEEHSRLSSADAKNGVCRNPSRSSPRGHGSQKRRSLQNWQTMSTCPITSRQGAVKIKKCLETFHHSKFMKIVFDECPMPAMDEGDSCHGHHKTMAKEVRKMGDGCAGDSEAENKPPEEVAADYEKSFCLIAQTEAADNKDFANDHCPTIVTPCRTKFQEVADDQHSPCTTQG